jgi:hypothetical protein
VPFIIDRSQPKIILFVAHARIVIFENFRKTPLLQDVIQRRSYFVQVMCLLLLTESNHNYIIVSACAQNNKCKLLERSLKYKAWYSEVGTLFFYYCASQYRQIPIKIVPFYSACAVCNICKILESYLYYKA